MHKTGFMRKIFAAAVISLMLAAMSGCNENIQQQNDDKNTDENQSTTEQGKIPQLDTSGEISDISGSLNPDGAATNQGITVNKLPYTTVEESDLTEELKAAVEELKMDGGYKVLPAEEGSQYIVIALGEKMSGGYSVEIVSVEDSEGKILVVYREKAPGPADSVLAAITYPYTVIKVDLPLPVTVVKDETPIPEPNPIPAEDDLIKPIDYTVVDEQNLPKDVAAAVEELKTNGGHKVLPAENNSRYVIIALGEKMTGGYSVEIIAVDDVMGKISLVYKEKAPASDDMVTEMITYPYTVLKLDSALEVDVIKSEDPIKEESGDLPQK